MKLLSSLFSEEELKSFEKKELKRVKEQEEHQAYWAEWIKENENIALGYIMMQEMFDMLSNIDNDDLITIKCTKKNLNEIIQFSSSRANEFKKSDYVQFCYDSIKSANPNNPLKDVMKTTTGCFSAGAFGHGGKKGSSRFNAKFTTSGTYEMKIPFGMPFLILDDSKLVLFEGFDYKPVDVNQEILDKYFDYKKGKKSLDLPF